MNPKSTYSILMLGLLIESTAYAQSSVTLFGGIDTGLDFTSNANGHHAYQMVNSEAASTKWGLMGKEDLGAGLSAIFKLDSGFNVNNGKTAAGFAFSRQSYVGLASNMFGTVTIGRQYDPTIDLWSTITAAGNTIGDFAAHPFDNDNADDDSHFGNSVKYLSPVWHGFQGEAMYAASNQAGAFATNRMYSGAGTYTLGALSAAFAYMRIDGGGTTATGAVGTDSLFVGSAQQNIDGGIKWTISDRANIAFAYSQVDIYNPTGALYLANVGDQNWKAWKFNNFEINGQYFFRPDLSFAGSYTLTHARFTSTTSGDSPNWHQVAASLTYAFSKRTNIYIQGAWQHTNSRTGTDLDAAQLVGAAAPSSNGNQMLYRLAMTHHF